MLTVDSVLEAVKFPTGFSGLDTGLTEMDGDAFCVCCCGRARKRSKAGGGERQKN